MGTVKYGLDAIKIIGGSIDEEVKWQIKNLPNELKGLVLEGLKNKNIINDIDILSH